MATVRQLATIKDVLENKMPVSVAMRKNGYSEESAQALKIKKTEAWQQAVAQYLPEYKVLKAHQEALEAKKIHGTGDDFIEIDDHPTRLKAVDLYYRLTGRMSESVRTDNRQINISLNGEGYVSPNNTLGLKPTLTNDKRKIPKP